MPQQKSTSFSAAKVANFGVVIAEMVEERMRLEKEVKRLRHHVSVLSKRNHQLMKEGKSWAASSIASDASLSSDDEEVETGEGERVRVVGSLVGEEARRKAHGDGRPDKWCEKGAEEFNSECQVRGRYLGRTKWKVAELGVAKEVVARSVAEEEEVVAEPRVRLPVLVKEGSKKRRVGEMTEEEKEIREVRGLVVPLGPRAKCGELLRVLGKESVFKDADPRLVAGGGSTPAAVGVSRRSEAWRQSPGVSGGYQLRPRVGRFRGRGFGGFGRGRGV